MPPSQVDNVAERLRRWTANPLGSPSVGSNPIVVASQQLHERSESEYIFCVFDTLPDRAFFLFGFYHLQTRQTII